MNPQQPYLNSKTFLNSLAVNDNNSSQLKTCSPDFKSTIPSDKPLFRRTSPRLHSQELPQTQSRERIVNEEQRDFEEEKTKEDQIPMFPASFNPRRASNMPAREKVQNWMKDIPFHYSTDNAMVYIDCFPAVASYSSSESGSQQELTDTDQILELQARRLTRYATRNYINDSEPIAHAEGDSYDDIDECYYESDGNVINFNDVEGDASNFLTTNQMDYIVLNNFE